MFLSHRLRVATAIHHSYLTNTDPFNDGTEFSLHRFEDNTLDDLGMYNATPINVTYASTLFNRCFYGDLATRYTRTDSAYPINGSGNDHALSFWFKAIPSTDTGALCMLSDGLDGFDGYALIWCSNTGIVSFSTKLGTISSNAGVNLADGNPHHIGFDVDTSNVLRMYVDGVAQTATKTSYYFTGAQYLYFGAQKTSSGVINFLNGYIDQTRVFSRSLTAVEWLELYTKEATYL